MKFQLPGIQCAWKWCRWSSSTESRWNLAVQDPVSADPKPSSPHQQLSKFPSSTCNHFAVPVFAAGARQGSQLAPGQPSNQSSSGIFSAQLGFSMPRLPVPGCRSLWVLPSAQPSNTAAGTGSPSGRGLRCWTGAGCHEDNAQELGLACQEACSVPLCIASD